MGRSAGTAVCTVRRGHEVIHVYDAALAREHLRQHEGASDAGLLSAVSECAASLRASVQRASAGKVNGLAEVGHFLRRGGVDPEIVKMVTAVAKVSDAIRHCNSTTLSVLAADVAALVEGGMDPGYLSLEEAIRRFGSGREALGGNEVFLTEGEAIAMYGGEAGPPDSPRSVGASLRCAWTSVCVRVAAWFAWAVFLVRLAAAGIGDGVASCGAWACCVSSSWSLWAWSCMVRAGGQAWAWGSSARAALRWSAALAGSAQGAKAIGLWATWAWSCTVWADGRASGWAVVPIWCCTGWGWRHRWRRATAWRESAQRAGTSCRRVVGRWHTARRSSRLDVGWVTRFGLEAVKRAWRHCGWTAVAGVVAWLLLRGTLAVGVIWLGDVCWAVGMLLELAMRAQL